ncbi:Rho GTPase activating protein 8 [Homo sapiens]|uniref:Rho GTPase activating protein 8 n=1 Tax=Homo sapiens TaxID=9606 RepID=F8WCV8_HUMAN|nr:Rho GTPase activating protein 8 [Homo sapiens]KAI4003380.1 Rho GTPase activating protein 8 [Homo sapiens]
MAGQDPALSTSHPFYDVARHGILQVAGDDRFGRRVVTFSCCRMPPSHELDHQRLLEYLKYTLDQYVENDYTIVYFHYGLNSRNKPSLGWLQSAYKEFDRKDGLTQPPWLTPVIPVLWEAKVQEELEGPLRGAPHQLHQGPVEHLEAPHQSQVWEESHLFQLPE